MKKWAAVHVAFQGVLDPIGTQVEEPVNKSLVQ
jgi:hypothetical protein